jgi:hypothetical protein
MKEGEREDEEEEEEEKEKEEEEAGTGINDGVAEFDWLAGRLAGWLADWPFSHLSPVQLLLDE